MFALVSPNLATNRRRQLDAPEVRGYLDPGRRGDRADECDAIEMFLGDSLKKR
jgi:hypothetical protein